MNIIKTNFTYKQPLIPLNLDKVFFIIVHHPDAINASPEDIHQWHLENGWAGFGYNEYIRKDGTVYIGRGDYIGAQCANMNSKSYGICCEGNYDIETEMPQAQFNSLVERVKYNSNRFKNYQETVPHNRFNSTSCPGRYFPFDKIINSINNNNDQLVNDLEVLKSRGIINSPDYWINNCVDGGIVKGEYARTLIHNFASKL